MINKTDLATAVEADLDVMARDSKKMRGDGPLIFEQVKNSVGVGEILNHIIHAWQHTTGVAHAHLHGSLGRCVVVGKSFSRSGSFVWFRRAVLRSQRDDADAAGGP